MDHQPIIANFNFDKFPPKTQNTNHTTIFPQYSNWPINIFENLEPIIKDLLYYPLTTKKDTNYVAIALVDNIKAEMTSYQNI
jgi:hypothetical protein